jgi:F420-dependent oxidoreductase-like protein
VQFAVECERLGVDFCWSVEAWGQDAVAPLAYLAARTHRIRLGTGIMQISARVPAMTAMTALTMAAISQDRFVLGLGVSGPQVVEGLHGTAFAYPLERLGEYLDILSLAFRGQRLEYSGRYFELPRPGGEGKALRLAQVPSQSIPVYIAALGPASLRLTGARADGWLATCFIPEASPVYLAPLIEGLESAGRAPSDLDLQAGGAVGFGAAGDRLAESVRSSLAFRLGAMGSRQHNFYNLAYQRAGYPEEASRVQELWLAGHRDQARAAVTDEMVYKSSFIGTDAMVQERVRAFQRAGISTIRFDPEGESTSARLDNAARFLDLVHRVEAEDAP